MKVIHEGEVPAQADPNPLFEGRVTRQPLVTDQMAQGIRIAVVNFSPGARTVLHSHTNEQVLYVVAGRGILATEQEEHVVTPGATIFVPPGEKHWHGATRDSSFSHLSITTPGKTEF
ncbi:MAG: cupin domain-containing protein [Dehalococcoidia bacterium]